MQLLILKLFQSGCKGAVKEYLERYRKSLEELFNDPNFPQGAVDDIEQHIESPLESIRQSIEKDLLTDNAYTRSGLIKTI